MILYILPRLLYKLGAVIVSKTEIANLERAYKKSMQSLPDLREAEESANMLFGLLPAEAELLLKVLSLFGVITRLDNDHPLRRLALRQAD